MRQCKKQTTVAIIMKDGKLLSMGTNEINADIDECPRVGYKSGEGYHLCKEICKQEYHAEEAAVYNANVSLAGATLYLMGHTYCCDNCKAVMKSAGITRVVIPDAPLQWDVANPEHYDGSIRHHIDEEGTFPKLKK